MPSLVLPIQDDYTLVSRRMVLSIARHLMSMTSIPNDCHVIFKGDSSQALTWNSETKLFRRVEEDVNPTRLQSEVYLEIEFKETITEEGYARNNNNRSDQPPIWQHEKLDLWLKPIYSQREFEMNLTYRTESTEKSSAFRNEILVAFCSP